MMGPAPMWQGFAKGFARPQRALIVRRNGPLDSGEKSSESVARPDLVNGIAHCYHFNGALTTLWSHSKKLDSYGIADTAAYF